MKFEEAFIESELLFEKEMEEYLLRSQTISCKLPEYHSFHSVPELKMTFTEPKLSEAPIVIEQKRYRSKTKKLW